MHRFFGLLIFALLLAPPAWGQIDILDSFQNNEFGGKTDIFRSGPLGIREGQRLYDSGGSLMREIFLYEEDRRAVSGIMRKTMDYMFNVKIREIVEFTQQDALRRRVAKTISHFEQSTGQLARKETHFVEKHKGYSVAVFEEDVMIRMEWYFPLNQDGLERKIAHYREGRHLEKEELFFTPRSTSRDGVAEQIIFYVSKKPDRQEWTYSDEWARTHGNIKRKVLIPYNNPSYTLPSQMLYFDLEGQLMER